MQLRYRFRLHPTPAQRKALAKAFGCARVVYNDGLRLREEAHRAGLPWVSDGDLLRLVTTEAKRTPDRAWLAEVSAVVLQQSVADLHRAYRNYFAALAEMKTERAKGNKQVKLRVHKPRLKRRHYDQAIRFTANSRFRVLSNGRLRLPKVGDLRVRWSRELPRAQARSPSPSMAPAATTPRSLSRSKRRRCPGHRPRLVSISA